MGVNPKTDSKRHSDKILGNFISNKMGSVVTTLPEGESHEAPGKVAERGSNLIQRRWQVGGQEGDSGE